MKTANRYRFILEDGTDEELSNALKVLLPMGEKETIGDGEKENRHMGQNRTINGMPEKTGSNAALLRDSTAFPMGQKETSNHLNQKKEPNEAGPFAPPTDGAVGPHVPQNGGDDSEPTEAEIEAVIKKNRNRIGPAVAKKVARHNKAKSMGNREA